jgi:thiamine biosynthesis lipoprotein
LKTLDNKIRAISGLTHVAAYAAIFILAACGAHQKSYQKIEGATMGTTYHIQYLGTQPETMKSEIDQLLVQVNRSLSTYDPTSTISLINSNQAIQTDAYFKDVFTFSQEVYAKSGGAFDPTVGPLVNAWGFGPNDPATTPDSATIDSILDLVGFDKVSMQGEQLVKVNPSIQLDFSAIAKGYGVDKVANLLESKGIEHFMVEIGGEVVVKGQNRHRNPWMLGINMPVENSDELFALARLSQGALATSGNYRNYYDHNGQRVAHTINPKTGRSEVSNLVSASVIAPNCALADAYATACMVLGLEESKKLATKELGLYLIFIDHNGKLDDWASPGFESTFTVAL